MITASGQRPEDADIDLCLRDSRRLNPDGLRTWQPPKPPSATYQH